MAQASMPPVQEARSIFGQLGYAVSGNGSEMLAERKWRTVQVTALRSSDATECRPVLADGGNNAGHRLRCFVTWDDQMQALRDRLSGIDLPYEWAIIGVSDDGSDYHVVHQARA
ncbi:hypothetical protein [Haloferax sp. DFSO60]|uniref:DUF7116 family protein n=1 Tax=Haloferax sp. DFSO60 TaxID=3388652 RepID=UPI00397E81B3